MKVKGEILFKKICDYAFCWRNVETAEHLCRQIKGTIDDNEWHDLFYCIMEVSPTYPDVKPISWRPWRPDPVDMWWLAETTKKLQDKYRKKIFEVDSINKRHMSMDMYNLVGQFN